MPDYEAVIGLEVHVQLATKSKLFCSCSTKFGAEPNSNVCEVCSAMPGALPVPNREAIHYAVQVGMASNCKINLFSRFARKNYFYPDLPHGYQISQFELPLCEHGYLEIETEGQKNRIGITRIHLEGDAGKNTHSSEENLSFVDLNRAGTPLIEIVSEPDMRSAKEAAAYLRNLHSLVTYLGVCDGNMEEGSFRCDANVSLRPKGAKAYGVRTELKNLNSFRNVQRAIEFEIERQADLLSDGQKIVQETRLYDAEKNITVSMRSKEEAQDYRYFPDPDLQPLSISEIELNELRANMPELPWIRTKRFVELTKMPLPEVEILLKSRALADYFEQASQNADPKQIAHWIIGPLLRECTALELDPGKPQSWRMTPEALAELVNIIDRGLINTKTANDIFGILLQSGEMPESYVQNHGLMQVSDAAELESIVDKIIAANPEEAKALANGKTKLLSFFVGQAMRATSGKANPAMVNEMLKKKLAQIGN